MKYRDLTGYFIKSYDKQMKIGRKIEREHDKTFEKILGRKVNKKKKQEYAEMIADDHIREFSDYYDRLIKMEKEAKNERMDK